jgi:hypothetical protein
LILNYKRPGNTVQICERFFGFCPITIINNNPGYSIPQNFYEGKIINNNQNKYCIDRWYHAVRCKTPYVFLLDDDILPSKKTFLEMRREIILHPTSLVGIYGKNNIKSAKCYEDLDTIWCSRSEVDIVVGAAIMAQTKSLRKIFKRYIVPMNRPNRGDDIIVSLAMTDFFKNKHYIVDADIELLPEGEVGLNLEEKENNNKRWNVLLQFEERFKTLNKQG